MFYRGSTPAKTMNTKIACSILALCETPQSRQKTVQFCDELIRRFWDKYQITVTWFTHDELLDPARRKNVHQAAQQARLVVIETTQKPIPDDVFEAIQKCLLARTLKEGFFAGITPENHRNQLLLRNLAHAAGMDFISEVPANIECALPDSPESCTTRAQEISHLLSDILHRPPSITK